MDLPAHAAGQLHTIRSLLERATVYRSISVPGAAVGGAAGAAVAAVIVANSAVSGCTTRSRLPTTERVTAPSVVMPVAVNTFVVAEGMGMDAPYTAELIAVSTVLSVGTLPLWMGVLGMG